MIIAEMELLQNEIGNWISDTFSPKFMTSTLERSLRVVEETVELAQANGVPMDLILQVIDKVYERPAGEPIQEMGGTMITVLALAQHMRVNSIITTFDEMNRIGASGMKEKIRAKVKVAGKIHDPELLPIIQSW